MHWKTFYPWLVLNKRNFSLTVLSLIVESIYLSLAAVAEAVFVKRKKEDRKQKKGEMCEKVKKSIR